MGRPSRAAKAEKMVCLCNAVPQSTVEGAITHGCNTLGEIFDQTSAGAGPCGGTCQGRLIEMLKSYHATKTFPQFPERKRHRR
jgi:NAD(P)H-nitrite reductase large subunit